MSTMREAGKIYGVGKKRRGRGTGGRLPPPNGVIHK